MRFRMIEAELDGLHVAVDELRLLGVRLCQQFANALQVQVEQRDQYARVADVLHQDAGAHPVEILIAHPGERHAQNGDVFTLQQGGARPGRVEDEVAARGDFLHILRIGFGIHRHHDVDAAGARNIRIARHPDFVPGGEALDVGREVVLPHHGNAASENRLHQQGVGARRAGAVHRGDLDDEIVDASCGGFRHALPERVRAMRATQAIFGSFACCVRASSAANGQCT